MGLYSAFAVLAICGACAALVRREIRACVLEPILAEPVVILESDDWGPAGPAHAAALNRLSALLARYADAAGRHPKLALGVILAIPEPGCGRDLEARGYRRVTLADPRMQDLREALLRGRAAGVFSLQLHGLEHYWPPSVVAAAARDPVIAAWLSAPDWAHSEQLPPALQSRWTDAASLPSRPHSPRVVAGAVAEEVALFEAVFGAPPAVFVPPTFLWNDEVEQAVAARGLETLVTPGRRYVARAADGSLVSDDRRYRNGEHLPSGLVSVVRDIYFEPAYGHRPERALEQILRRASLGRPALLEIHRCNFIGEAAQAQDSLEALRALFGQLAARLPDVRYLTTEELGRHYRAPNPGNPAFEQRWFARARIMGLRLWDRPRVRKTLALAFALCFAAAALGSL